MKKLIVNLVMLFITACSTPEPLIVVYKHVPQGTHPSKVVPYMLVDKDGFGYGYYAPANKFEVGDTVDNKRLHSRDK